MLTQCSSVSCFQDARGEEGIYKGADALVIDAGANNEEELYSKSKALQTWLVGYELTETIILICSRSIYVLTGKKKGERPRARRTCTRAGHTHSAECAAYAADPLHVIWLDTCGFCSC